MFGRSCRLPSVGPIIGVAGPDGKQFALVLTHDVEGKEGLVNAWS
jgi:hypothetical protein